MQDKKKNIKGYFITTVITLKVITFQFDIIRMADKAIIEVRVKVGQLFKKYRKQKKLSYRKIEAITGIDHSWVSKFEKGKVNFEIDTLLRLASGLKIQIKELTDFSHGFVED